MMRSSTLAIIVLVVAGTYLTVEAQFENYGLLQYAYKNWVRALEVYSDTSNKLEAKGYDMEQLGEIAQNAVDKGEEKFENATKKTYPELIPILKPVVSVGLEYFPDVKDWNTNLMKNVVEKIVEKEPNGTKAMHILSDVASKWVNGFHDSMIEQTININVTIPTDPSFNMTGFYSNLYKCVNHVYQGEWRKFNGPCNETSSRFWERCAPYELCKQFEVNKA